MPPVPRGLIRLRRSCSRCTGALSGRFAAGVCSASAACRVSCTISTSGPSTAACGRRVTPDAPGRPIFDAAPVGSIGALAVAPSDRERYLRRHRRGRHALGYRPGCGPVPLGATRAHLAADRARTTRSRSAASWSIRPIRTWCWSRHWGIPTAPTRCAAYSARPTAARPGSVRFTRTQTPARSISPLSRERPSACTPLCGRRAGRRGMSIHPPAAPAAACTSRTTAGRRGRPSPATACPTGPVASASPFRLRSRSGCSR